MSSIKFLLYLRLFRMIEKGYVKDGGGGALDIINALNSTIGNV